MIQQLARRDDGWRLKQAGDRIGEGRLAAAALASEAEYFAAMEGKADVVHGMHGPTIGEIVDGKPLDFEQGKRCLHAATAFPRRRRRPFSRRRGSAISSMPKLSSIRPDPSKAMQSPGGMNHHQAPWKRALPL